MMAEFVSDAKKPLSCSVAKLDMVIGLRISGGTEAASTGRLNAVRKIHRNGTATRTRPAASRASRIPSTVLFFMTPLSAAAAEEQVDQGNRDGDHDDQHHAHRGRVPDLLVLEPGVVDLQVQRRARDPGTAG